MRSLRSRLIQEIGGRQVLREIYNAVQAGWQTSRDYYQVHGLRDGHGLTALRRDHVEAALAAVCARHPSVFPAFDCGRRRTRSFVLLETEGVVVSAAIVARRNDVLPETGYRRDAGRQIALLHPDPARERPVIAVLLVVNGRPRPFAFRDRPREVVVRFVDGAQYFGEEISLDDMFGRRWTHAPSTLPLPRTVRDLGTVRITVLPERIERHGRVRLKPIENRSSSTSPDFSP